MYRINNKKCPPFVVSDFSESLLFLQIIITGCQGCLFWQLKSRQDLGQRWYARVSLSLKFHFLLCLSICLIDLASLSCPLHPIKRQTHLLASYQLNCSETDLLTMVVMAATKKISALPVLVWFNKKDSKEFCRSWRPRASVLSWWFLSLMKNIIKN